MSGSDIFEVTWREFLALQQHRRQLPPAPRFPQRPSSSPAALLPPVHHMGKGIFCLLQEWVKVQRGVIALDPVEGPSEPGLVLEVSLPRARPGELSGEGGAKRAL